MRNYPFAGRSGTGTCPDRSGSHMAAPAGARLDTDCGCAPAWPFFGMAPGSARIVYADPPWRFETRSERGQGRSPQRHYGCMALDDIMALPVARLAAPDSVLFLWIVKTMLPEALEVIRAWGFRYKTIAFTWVKTRPSGREFLNTGYWTRGNPELVLLASRGQPHRVSRAVRELVEDPADWWPDGPDAIHAHAREHSRKPDEVRDRIVRLMGEQPPPDAPHTTMVEMFARTAHPGWLAWGNEAGRFAGAPAGRGHADD